MLFLIEHMEHISSMTGEAYALESVFQCEYPYLQIHHLLSGNTF